MAKRTDAKALIEAVNGGDAADIITSILEVIQGEPAPLAAVFGEWALWPNPIRKAALLNELAYRSNEVKDLLPNDEQAPAQPSELPDY